MTIELGMYMFLVHASHQTSKLPPQVGWSPIGSVEQHGLEPSVALLD